MIDRRDQGIPPFVHKKEQESDPEFDWETGEIPRTEVQIKAVRGGGPGGQAINTTSNNMEVRWHIGQSRVLTPEQKMALRAFAPSKITKADEIIFTCQSERSQKQNIEEALNRLNLLVRDALTPQAKRVETKKPRGVKAKEKRMDEADKKRKAGRGKVKNWD